MKTFIFFSAIFVIFTMSALAQTNGLNIIPQPSSVNRMNGEFKFSRKTKIVATDDAGRKSAAVLNELLVKNYGFKLDVTDKPPKKNAIVFSPSGLPDTMHIEGYGLTVSPNGIFIFGNEIGQFYAIQTFLQLLPVNFKT